MTLEEITKEVKRGYLLNTHLMPPKSNKLPEALEMSMFGKPPLDICPRR